MSEEATSPNTEVGTTTETEQTSSPQDSFESRVKEALRRKYASDDSDTVEASAPESVQENVETSQVEQPVVEEEKPLSNLERSRLLAQQRKLEQEQRRAQKELEAEAKRRTELESKLKDPFSALKAAGVETFEEFVKGVATDKWKAPSPEDEERAEARRIIEELKAEREAIARERQERERAVLMQEERTKVKEHLDGAVDAYPILTAYDDAPDYVQHMARQLISEGKVEDFESALKHLEDNSRKNVAPVVKNRRALKALLMSDAEAMKAVTEVIKELGTGKTPVKQGMSAVDPRSNGGDQAVRGGQGDGRFGPSQGNGARFAPTPASMKGDAPVRHEDDDDDVDVRRRRAIELVRQVQQDGRSFFD